jgi:hypothetical protein
MGCGVYFPALKGDCGRCKGRASTGWSFCIYIPSAYLNKLNRQWARCSWYQKTCRRACSTGITISAKPEQWPSEGEQDQGQRNHPEAATQSRYCNNRGSTFHVYSRYSCRKKGQSYGIILYKIIHDLHISATGSTSPWESLRDRGCRCYLVHDTPVCVNEVSTVTCAEAKNTSFVYKVRYQ